MKIFIYDNYQTRETVIYAIRKAGDREEIIGYDSETGCLVITTIEGYEPLTKEDVKPLLKFPLMFKNAILNGFANALSEQNIKIKDENLIEGKLIATEKHLEDLREITKHVLKIKK